MSAEFQKAWAKTGRAEGGYVNHPSDPGGETNHGITIRVARANGYTGPMQDLQPEMAVEIAKREYWDRIKGDDLAALSPAIAQEVFDTNFNFYFGAAGKFLQRALSVVNRNGRDFPDLNVDGNIGPATIAALAAFLKVRGKDGETVMLRLLNAQQACDYMDQCRENKAKEDFMFGWALQRVVI